METVQTETTVSLAGVAKDISYIQRDMTEIKQSVKDLVGVYATQVKLDETNLRIKRLEDSSNLWKWLSPTLSAVVASFMTFLIINYLNNLAKI